MYESQLEVRYRSYINRLIISCAVVFCTFRVGTEFLEGTVRSAIILAVASCVIMGLLLLLQKKDVKNIAFTLPFFVYVSYLGASFAINSFKYIYDFYIIILVASVAYFNFRNFLAFVLVTQIMNLFLSIFVLQSHVTGSVMVHFVLILGVSLMLFLVIYITTNKTKEAAKAFISFDALMKTTSNILILLDEQNKVKYMSRSASKTFNKDETPEKWTGTDILDLLNNDETKEQFNKILNTHSFYESYIKMNIGEGLKTYHVAAGHIIEEDFKGMLLHLNDISELARLKEIAERDSLIDSLTQIPNRRALDRHIEQSWIYALREQVNLSFLMIDIDFFKAYNDTYGHVQGDELLKSMGMVFKRCLKRSSDFVARFGGEEFGVLLYATNAFQASIVAEKIRKIVENEIIYNSNKEKTKVTISIGVCSVIPKRGSTHSFIIEEADKALYKAKMSGRNRVCSSDLPVTVNQGS